MWEMSIGLLGGALLGVLFLAFNRPAPNAEPAPGAAPSPAEYLLGLWLPVLASAYHTIPFRGARAFRFLGGYTKPEEEALREALSWAAAPPLLIVAVYVVYRTRRAPAETGYVRDPQFVGRLFLGMYAVFFLLSYIPRFGVVFGTDLQLGWTQAIYGAAFVASLVAYRRLRRAGPAGPPY